MDARRNEPALMEITKVERTSDREVVVTRTFDAPAHLVFEAWADPELFRRWWVPKSMDMTLHSCEMDVRTGGTYRLGFGDGMDFFGRYLEVTPPSRIVWTNEESADGPLSTVTFEERGDHTLLVLTERYPSKEALDDAIASGSTATSGAGEQFDALDELLIALVNP